MKKSYIIFSEFCKPGLALVAFLLCTLFSIVQIYGNNKNLKNWGKSLSCNAEIIAVEAPIEITSEPENVTVCAGNPINFFVIAEGQNLSYQWQRTYGGNGQFQDIFNGAEFSGTRTSNLVITTNGTSLSNTRFRVIITDNKGNSIKSNSALLQLNKVPDLVYNHPSNQVVCAGNNISFETYIYNGNRQWQVSNDNGVSWSDLTNNGVYQNVNAGKLDITNTPANFNNNLYRIKVSNQNCSVYSNSAALQVDLKAIITQQPKDAIAEFGDNAVIEAGVTGNNLTYQWQTQTYGPDWYNINNNVNYSGAKTKRLEFTVGYNQVDGSGYRLLVTNKNGCVSISEVAFLNRANDSCETSNTWTGEANTNWNNTANWSCNSRPTLETNVLIPENLTSNNFPVIYAGTNALTKNLSIENGASVKVNENWLRIAGTLANSGFLNAETGSVSFEGTSAQIIPVGAFENNRIQNLRIDNTSGVTSEAIIDITGTLKVEAGNFDTGNNLTLISNAGYTAFIDGSGQGEVSGNVTVQRYLDNTFGYKYISSPLQNAVVGDFQNFLNLTNPSTQFPHVYSYNENRTTTTGEDATGWEPYTNAAAALEPMRGYAFNFSEKAAPRTLEISGKVNNGTIVLNSLANNGGQYTNGFHLIGNPYPSPINWDAAGWTKTNIDNAIYFFKVGTGNRYTGSYVSYVNGIASVPQEVSSIIPTMQGFFVRVNDEKTGTLQMTNAVRHNEDSQKFYRSKVQAQPALLRLSASYKGEQQEDAMVVYFQQNASAEFEADLDAQKLMNTDVTVPNIYSLTHLQEALSINAVNANQNLTIPLGLTAEISGEIKIKIRDLENLPANLHIYLKDKQTNRIIDLQARDFTFPVKKGKYEARFELIFTSQMLEEQLSSNSYSIFNEDGEISIKFNLKESQQAFATLNNLNGQVLSSLHGRGKEKKSFSGYYESAVYIVVVDIDGERTFKKVLLRK